MSNMLPQEYINLLNEIGNNQKSVFYRIEDWNFWPQTIAVDQSNKLINEDLLNENEFAIADNSDGQYLFYKLDQSAPHHIYLADESFGKPFFAYSLDDILHYDKTEELIEATTTENYQSIDISPIKDYPGCVYWYAFSLMTSPYDEDYSEEINEYAATLLRQAAEAGHPEAAAELADYYSFQDDMDIEEVIKWRKKSVELGDEDEKYELADFIIDYKPSDHQLAVKMLEELTEFDRFADRAYLKLSKLYINDEYGIEDHDKAIEYVNKAVSLGNFVAKADLAFYYFNGLGVEMDKEKALKLLIEANDEARKKMGEEPWNEVIEQIKSEI
ncbi:tetratricopeptide repeat protein [Marinigracilibium pacificum]|uniref:Sel1 repeat family protein n=1 Tax=Marinigracilibium pacificum TaxID=2729599 RepID=A0A848J0X1_9BACT|nr:tetratricopeptide repeat protein [Marinigracilibium pacificum]NMM47939.1 sel1 repeat family protein [Marinigracilibium pacificum]